MADSDREYPASTQSSPSSSHLKRGTSSSIASQRFSKVVRRSIELDMEDSAGCSGATALATAVSVTDGRSEEHSYSPKKRDKGKGKAKATYVPDLPEEVWRRIFQIHYSDVVDEWQHTDRLRMALTPLLIGPDLYRVALPILYVHPVVSYETIPAFARAVNEPSLYLNGDFPKSYLVRHLTIRPSPVVPSAVPSQKTPGVSPPRQATLYTIHLRLKDALSPFRELQSFTLKEAMILHQPDASVLFAALSVIAPKKARLEFRMWDLNDSSIGEELLSMTGASSYFTLNRYAHRRPDTSVVDRTARATHDTFRQPLLEAWRDALLKGTEFEAPTWWLEGPGDNNNGNGAAGQPPAHGNAVAAGNLPLPTPPPPSNQPSMPRHSNTAPSGRGGTPRGNVDNRSQRSAHRGSVHDWRTRGIGRNAHRPPVPHPIPPPDMSATRTAIELISDEDDGSSHESVPDSPVQRLSQSALDTMAISGLEEQNPRESIAEAVASPSVAQRSQVGNSVAQRRAGRGSSRGNFVPGTPTHRSRVDVSSTVQDSQSPASVPPPRPQSPRSAAEHSRLRRRVSEVTSAIARPLAAINADSSERSSLPAHDTGLTSHPLAHRVREQLHDLLEHWLPGLQALSIVTHDPLSTLIIRSPQLDFWPSISVPHIRVQLPRACHALGVFQGTKEAARARHRRREAEDNQVVNPIQQALAQVQALALLHGQTPPSTLTPGQIQALTLAKYEEERLVGGDGNGGGLVNEDVRLFEIEVNTRQEMGDDVWIRCGHQLPPQVCRILAGAPEHDWANVRWDDSTRNSPIYARSESLNQSRSRSPAPLGSPAFSLVSLESDDDGDGLSATGSLSDSAGATYDAEAAEAQLLRTEARRRKAEQLAKSKQ